MSKVLIDFVTQNSQIEKTIDLLEKTGQVDKKNAEQFKKTNSEYESAAKKRQQLIESELKLIEKNREALKKAFDPNAITSFNAAIKESENRIKTLRGEVTKTEGGIGKLSATIKDIGAAIGIAFGAQQLISFGKEAVMLAAKGEGIRTAFSKIGDDKSLERLREATRGTISDIELMSKALRAKDFGISTELLAKGLEYAGKQAARTGQDVDYLVESLVSGIGRRSTLVLDNLGISASELQTEVKKLGGDFNEAVGSIINRRLEEMGEVSETSLTGIQRLQAGFDNFKETAGNVIMDGINPFIEALVGLPDIFDMIVEGLGEEDAALRANRKELTLTTEQIKEAGKAYEAFTVKQLENQKANLLAAGATAGELDKFDKLSKEIQGNILLQKESSDQFSKLTIEQLTKLRAETEKETKSKYQLVQADKLSAQERLAMIDAEIQKKKDAIPKNIAVAEEGAKKETDKLKEERDRRFAKEIEDNRRQAELLVKLKEQALKIENDALLLEVEKGSEEELAIKIENIKKMRDFKLENEVEHQQDYINIVNQAENDILKLKIDYDNKWYDEKAKNDEEEYKKQQKVKEDRAKLELEQQKKLQEETVNIALMASDAISEINNINTSEKIALLEKELEIGQITQQEFDKQERELKRKAAGRDKLLGIFNIGVKTAEGVMNYLSNPVTAPLVPFVLATGAIQAGLVAARPIPFAKGTKSVTGGVEGKDSVHALLMPNEMVIPVDKKKKYEPILNAIFDERISPDILNNLVMGNALRSGSQTNSVDEYGISSGMKMALRDGIYVKNMPKHNGISEVELKLMLRRGIA